MNKKSIEDFDPSLYATYAVTDIAEDFKLYTVHPNGLKEYFDYDIYDIDNKSIIAFTKMSFLKTDFIFRIISENYIQEINSENYEDVCDVLDGSYDESNYVFSIMNSTTSYEEAGGNNDNFVDDNRRCDLEGFIAVNFNDINFDGKPDLFDRNYFNDESIVGWSLFLASMGNIYIVRLQLSDAHDRAYKDWAGCVVMGQTFMHVVKMAYEWNLLYEEPWSNRQSIATKCNRAFKDFNMPQDVLQEIHSLSPSTSIEMYLSGDENPRKSIVEDKNVPPLFKRWYMSRLRYRTLHSLVDNYPSSIDIPQKMLDTEAQFFENVIYNFLLNNNLDLESTKCVDILKIIYSTPSISSAKTKNNSIDDIIIKYFSTIDNEEKELVKQYLLETRRPMVAHQQY